MKKDIVENSTRPMPALYHRIRNDFTETLTFRYHPAPAPAPALAPALAPAFAPANAPTPAPTFHTSNSS